MLSILLMAPLAQNKVGLFYAPPANRHKRHIKADEGAPDYGVVYGMVNRGRNAAIRIFYDSHLYLTQRVQRW